MVHVFQLIFDFNLCITDKLLNINIKYQYISFSTFTTLLYYIYLRF